MIDRYGDPIEPPDETPDELWAAQKRAMDIAHCGMCDDDGYRGGQVCDHTDRSEIARRGSALVREALQQAKARKQ